MGDLKAYLQAAGLGTVAGMRTMSAPTLISQAARRGRLGVPEAKAGLLESKALMPVVALIAVAELIADKLPGTPARTRVGPLTARIFSGALSGAVLLGGRKKSRILGAVLGAAGAVGAAYGAYHLRKAISRRWDLPDRVVAVAEDALVGGLSLALSSSIRPHV